MYALAKIKDNLPPELFAMFSSRSVRYPQSSSVACSKPDLQYINVQIKHLWRTMKHSHDVEITVRLGLRVSEKED
jgi:hypothetical protein